MKRGLRVAFVASVASAAVLLTGGIASAGSTPHGAEDDLYETPFNTAIVLSAPAPSDNDTPLVESDFEGTEIVTLPASGTLSAAIGDEADGVTYTPNPGFTGSDSFVYDFVYGYDFSENESFDVAAFHPGVCDEFGSAFVCVARATVFIEVGAPPVTTTTTTVAPTTTTTTTVAVAAATVPPTTTTTVAAQAQLPVTGSNGALAVIGFSAAAAGAALVTLARRRHARV